MVLQEYVSFSVCYLIFLRQHELTGWWDFFIILKCIKKGKYKVTSVKIYVGEKQVFCKSNIVVLM